MKKLMFLLMFIAAAMWQSAIAGQDSDLVWSTQVGSSIERVKFIPDLSGNPLSKGYIAVGHGTEVLFYDVTTHALVKQYNKYMGGIWDFDITDDGKYMAVITEDSNIVIWDLIKEDTLRTIITTNLFYRIRFVNNNLIIGVAPLNSHNGPIDSGQVHEWDILTGHTIKQTKINERPLYLTINQQKKLLVISTGDSWFANNYNVELWDINSLTKISKLYSHTSTIRNLTISNDGNYLATSSDSEQIIKIWDMNLKALIKTFIHEKNLHFGGTDLQLKFTPNSGYLISSGGGFGTYTTRFWDTKNFNLQNVFNPPYGSNGSFDLSTDSSKLIIGRGAMLYLLNVNWNNTAIGDKPVQKNEQIFPNPTGTNINIPIDISSKILSINFTNLTGQIVKQITNVAPVSNFVNVDISFLQSGTYFINIVYTNKIITFKLEKVR